MTHLGMLLGIFLTLIGLVGLIAAALVKNVLHLDGDSAAPLVTVAAEVAGRRREDRFQGTKY